MLMARQSREGNEAFFAQIPADERSAALVCAQIIKRSQDLPAGVQLMVSSSPLAVAVADCSAEELAGLIPADRLALWCGVVELMHRLGGEVQKKDYLLDEFCDELARLPVTRPNADESWARLAALRGRGLPIEGLPMEAEQMPKAMLSVSTATGIALEYLLGNLNKAATLLERFGVRNETINASALFHNYMNGFLDVDLGGAPSADAELASRAATLAKCGTEVKVFRKGDFNSPASTLSAAEIESLAEHTSQAYGIPKERFLQFLGAVLSRQEARLRTAPKIALTALLQTFKFNDTDRDLVSAARASTDDPTRWKETALGRALTALRPELDWLAVSAGIKAAGNIDAIVASESMRAAVEALRAQSKFCAITLYSGCDGIKRENLIAQLSLDELLFDLYCLAVLERRSLSAVLESATGVLNLFRSLEHPETPLNLNDIVRSRLSGQSYAALLSAHGLALGHQPLAEALARLKALARKVKLTLDTGEPHPVALERAGLDDFRKAVLRLARIAGLGHSPERVLSLIRERIVPEIRMLPEKVIAPGEHALGRLVELAAAGVPARYPLRRPWKKINLDPLAYMGSGLEPGIRNCLGCPVNTLYGLVNKTALATGFEEVITYEATGCFEVYSGIWPYTGKKGATLHGVFGGAPSELLGGLAARKARLKHAHKINGAQGAAYRAALKRTLHLGWGGDGATFDIGFGNLSGLFSRLQKLSQDGLDQELDQRALYVCYDNEGYQNTGNQYSAASSPGGNTTTNPQGEQRPMGNDLRKKPIVEIMSGHGASVSARMNIHRQEHIVRVVNRALEDGINGSFLHFLQPCTTGWKFTADSLTYDLAYLSEEGGLFSPVTFEQGVPYLEIYPTPRNPGDSFLKLQARFKHLLGGGTAERKNVQQVMDYYAEEWKRNLQLGGFEGEIPYADRLKYLEEEHRRPRVKV